MYTLLLTCVLLEVTLDDDFSLTKKKKKKKGFDLNDMSAALPVCLLFLITLTFLVVYLFALQMVKTTRCNFMHLQQPARKYGYSMDEILENASCNCNYHYP